MVTVASVEVTKEVTTFVTKKSMFVVDVAPSTVTVFPGGFIVE